MKILDNFVLNFVYSFADSCFLYFNLLPKAIKFRNLPLKIEAQIFIVVWFLFVFCLFVFKRKNREIVKLL